ncbi:hypothetical protein NDU88_001772 [Pleurodeles waltl]|uniref:Uncharacterized protein n=1 Tax=Pleurodeles waltl TaxID=8319 RepID=A0AAV7UWB0_PLEWA|nr:hypothetical protein NDU88_001772 [Pleurodeles waltl]
MDVWGSQSSIGHTVAAGVVAGLVLEEKLPCDGDLLVILGCPALECGTSKLCIGSVGSGVTLTLLLHMPAPHSCGG